MDKFSPPDVLAPAACHLLRLPSQLPGQLAQGFAIADYLHRVFVCQCCLLELSYQKWKTSSSLRIFHLSQPRVSSRQKSSHNSLLPLQRAFDPPIRFLLPEILVPKIEFRDSQIFFIETKTFGYQFQKGKLLWVTFFWQHLTDFPFQLLTIFYSSIVYSGCLRYPILDFHVADVDIEVGPPRRKPPKHLSILTICLFWPAGPPGPLKSYT